VHIRKWRGRLLIATLTLVSLLSPAAAFAGDGGAGSDTGGTGTGNGNGGIFWTYKDGGGYGKASLASVKKALADTKNGKRQAITILDIPGWPGNATAQTALTEADSECKTRYAAAHEGSGEAQCRLVGVGAVATDAQFTGHDGGFSQTRWLSEWNSVVSGKTYSFGGGKYTTTTPFTDGDTTINSLVKRETSHATAIVVIVLAQDEPPVVTPPGPPMKKVAATTSADSMTNTTSISTKTGVGGTKLVFADRITSGKTSYKVSNVKVRDGSSDVTSKFTFKRSEDTLTETWKGGALPSNHTFTWSFDVVVALPDVGKVTDIGSVLWNDKPTGNTDEHEFPTWKPSPDKAWIKYSRGRYMAVVDPKWTNAVGADESTVLDGDSIAAAVNAPVASNLAQAPKSFVITDDFTASDYLVDLGDLKQAKVYQADSTSETTSGVADIVNKGTDVTSRFTLSQNGTKVVATADADYLKTLKGREKALQVTLVVPFTVNYANGRGASQVRKDAGVKAGDEVAFCGAPSSSDADGSDTPFLNKGSEKLNDAVEKTNEPRICGYVPPVTKDVLAEASQGGGQESVDGRKVQRGQRVEYKLQTQPKLPTNLAYGITTVQVTDQYDAYVTPSKQTLEVTDLNSGDIVPKSKYTTQWDDAAHKFTISFADDYVSANWTASPRIIVRFEATVNDDAPVVKTVDNQWTLTLNNGITPSNRVTNRPVDPKPTKEDTQKDASVSIDGRTAMLGDELYYRLNLDASDLSGSAYLVKRLGIVDDYDDEYLRALTDKVQVLDAQGRDVTARFNLQVSDGVLYAFAKTVDTLIPATGETVKGDPQPTDLKAYSEATPDPLKDPGIDQSLLGQDYQVILPVKVIKVDDGHTITNQATQITNSEKKVTNVVANPLTEINPRKDVVVNVGAESANGKSIYLDHQFLYRLDSSVVPADRAYPLVSDWSLSDDYDETHDRFTGQWAVYATRDVLDASGAVVARKGDMLAGSHAASATHPDWFVFVEKDGKFSLDATQEYLDLVSANTTTEQSWSLFVQMERIKVGDVVNSFDETLNKVKRHSNEIITHTPDQTPAVTLEKYDVKSGLRRGDRDHADEALNMMSDEIRIGFKITNSGKVPLGAGKLSDETIEGSGTVVDMEYPENWKNLVLTPGESVTVFGTLKGVKAGEHHIDRGTTTWKPIVPCAAADDNPWDSDDDATDSVKTCHGNPVTARDEWNGTVKDPVLAETGSETRGTAMAMVAIASVGVLCMLVKRRTEKCSRVHGKHTKPVTS
jgi:adhesin isopeptide-forming family sspB-C2 type protein/fimbrial isopeptide formation D2 family protein